ncbi:MAG: hypothetical protein PHU64_02720 [Candidatus Omnitrophica bacterium]|nr:hypothetical protein [Candidatus Omnitrophota bacterium]MDD5430307.1 hypothetical protein [Candidatus Omnitrophota bacterium]
MVSFDDFSKLDLKIGKVIEVNPHPDAEKLYVLKVDIGEKVVTLVAGIKPFYEQDSLLGKQVVVLANLEPKTLRGIVSEGMLLAARSKDDLGLLTCDKKVDPGSKIG